MSTLKVNNISNVGGTKSETTDNIIDKHFSSWDTTSYTTGVNYQASTDLLVVATGYAATYTSRGLSGYTDSTTTPVQKVAHSQGDLGETTIIFPVIKGDYWRVNIEAAFTSYKVYTLNFGA